MTSYRPLDFPSTYMFPDDGYGNIVSHDRGRYTAWTDEDYQKYKKAYPNHNMPNNWGTYVGGSMQWITEQYLADAYIPI